jgi:hypothetical protein
VSGSRALPPRWLPQCSCVVIESSFDPGERLQAPGSLWFSRARQTCGTSHFIHPCTIVHATGFGLPPNLTRYIVGNHDMWWKSVARKHDSTSWIGIQHTYILCTVIVLKYKYQSSKLGGSPKPVACTIVHGCIK